MKKAIHPILVLSCAFLIACGTGVQKDASTKKELAESANEKNGNSEKSVTPMQ